MGEGGGHDVQVIAFGPNMQQHLPPNIFVNEDSPVHQTVTSYETVSSLTQDRGAVNTYFFLKQCSCAKLKLRFV